MFYSALSRMPWLLVFTLVLAGCGKPAFSLGKVSGKVAYDDGSVIPCDRMSVTFHPQSLVHVGKQTSPYAQATVDVKTGEILSLTTLKPDDGALLGLHKVTIVALTMNQYGGAPNGAVSEDYAQVSTTPLEFEVKAGTNVAQLSVKKPTSKGKRK